MPPTGAFAELNVRTYVTDGAHPGVWFFSLDAASRLAVTVARRWFHLNYRQARMSCRAEGDAVRYASDRVGEEAAFAGLYRPIGDVFRSEPGSLERWLTERYCLYAADVRGRLYRGEVHHAPWPLQPAEWRIERHTMTRPLGVDLPDAEPHLLFARRIETVAWAPRRLGAGPGA